jgi:undecaprenyl-diphosphatase
VLGTVHGLAEILPVSGSGHLALVQAWLDAPGGGGLSLALDLGELLAIGLVLSDPVRELARGLLALPRSLGRPLEDWNARTLVAGKVVVAAVPAAVVGLLFGDSVERAFASTDAIAGYLIVGGLVLAATRWAPAGEGAVTFRNAILIGWAQACAVLPGLSRTGTTIAVALLLGVGRTRAAEFSFLAAVPILLGAMMLELPEAVAEPSVRLGPPVLGFLASFGAGCVALTWLLRAVRNGSLHWFAAWCLALAAVALAVPRM